MIISKVSSKILQCVVCPKFSTSQKDTWTYLCLFLDGEQVVQNLLYMTIMGAAHLQENVSHSKNLHQCQSGEFVLSRFLCDSKMDCQDGSDEFNCTDGWSYILCLLVSAVHTDI